jgi:hypothetical protein
MGPFEPGDFTSAELQDVDHDGVDDTVLIQTDDDQLPEAIFTDSDGDGLLDAGMIDTDGNGVADVFVRDHNEDGQLDMVVVDANLDGIDDNVAAQRVAQEAAAASSRQHASARPAIDLSRSTQPVAAEPSATTGVSDTGVTEMQPSGNPTLAADPQPYDLSTDPNWISLTIPGAEYPVDIASNPWVEPSDPTTTDTDFDGRADAYDRDPHADDIHDRDADGLADGYDRDIYADDINDRDADGSYDGYDRNSYDSRDY